MDPEAFNSQENSSKECRDGGYGWVIVAGAFILYMNSFGLSLSIGLFFDQIVKVVPRAICLCPNSTDLLHVGI